MAKDNNQGIEGQTRVQYLERLLEEYHRKQTIQDVGFWLIEYPLEPLTPRLIGVLRLWLKEHNALTIKQNRRGSPHSGTRDVFPLITRMHRETGMSIEAACLMIVERLNPEIDPANLRRAYDRARTPHGKLLDAFIKAGGALGRNGSPTSDVQKAAMKFKTEVRKQPQAPKNRRIRTQKSE